MVSEKTVMPTQAQAELAVSEQMVPLSDAMKEFRAQMHLYKAGIRTVEMKLQTLDEEFHAKYDYNPIHHIETRLKEPRSIFKKMERLGVSGTIGEMKRALTDIAGVRVICNYISDTKTVAEMLLRQDDVVLVRKSDYIHEPKESGYRSLHLVVTVPVYLSERMERVPVEVQIRTIAMDCWASLEHHLRYKAEGEIPEDLRYRLRICAMAIAEVDAEMQEIKRAVDRNAP